MDLYWVPHPTLVFAPCTLDGDTVRFATDSDGQKISITASEVLDLDQVREEQLQGVDDICSMAMVTEGAMLHAVRVRFARQVIYTRVARILIAVNPFTALPIYSAQYLDEYSGAADTVELPPHIFAIGQDAILGLKGRSGCDQAVLISGESGAGKTESAKLVLSFVAESTQGGQGGLEEMILQTNPVLEAFGNAMTVRNNNSSRFGKWLDIRFSSRMDIMGCSVTSYLLEVTRVCKQAERERNYHVFYMLLQARREIGLCSLGLKDPMDYRYLKEGQRTAPGIDDARCFIDLKEAFSTLGFGRDQQLDVFRVLGAILELGNCDFSTETDETSLLDERPAKCASDLLRLPFESLVGCMVRRKIVVGKDVAEKPLNCHQARNMRDAISRLIYGRLFEYLIDVMNSSMARRNDPAGASITDSEEVQRLLGVLDIAGFESFAINSLEQLLINLSNEHLQQQFNHSIFKAELEDYKNEGVTLSGHVDFVDNADVLALLDGKGGILDILDEEGTMPKATDMTYVTKVLKGHNKHARLIAPKFPGELVFGVRHYAGNVTYTCDMFLEKNADKPPDDIAAALCLSESAMLQKFGEALQQEAIAQKNTRGKKVVSVSSGFRASLRGLMAKVAASNPHYIRCVKPNFEKVADVFDSKMVYDQLLFSGVLEAVRIRQQGYSSRLPFEEFVRRYQCIMNVLDDTSLPIAQSAVQVQIPNDTTPSSAAAPLDYESAARELVKGIAVWSSQARAAQTLVREIDFAFGKSKIFYKQSAHTALEIARANVTRETVMRIQRIWRGKRVARKFKALSRLQVEFRDYLQGLQGMGTSGNSISSPPEEPVQSLVLQLGSPAAVQQSFARLRPLLDRAGQVGLDNGLVQRAEDIAARMRIELDCVAELEGLRTSLDPVAIEKAAARAKSLGLPSTQIITEITDRARKLQVQLPLVRAMRSAISEAQVGAVDDERIRVIELAIAEAGLNAPCASSHTSMDSSRSSHQEWIAELGGEGLHAELTALIRSRLPAATSVSKAAQARNRMTVTGYGEDEQARLLASLSRCVEERDADVLEQQLGEAVRQGISVSELDDAKRMFEQLQSVPFVLQAIREAEAAVDVPTPSTRSVRALRNLTRQLQKLVGDAAACREAMRATQAATQRRSTHRMSSFFDFEDARLLSDVFGSLSNCQLLKTAWSGHRDSILPPGSLGCPTSAKMLEHSNVSIAEALTKVPKQLEGKAVQNFRNIQVWMCDKPAQECQRLASRDAVVELARSEPLLKDEIYVQVLKQMIMNPSQRSVLLGWELLRLLCESTTPCLELIDFVRTFLRQAAPPDLCPSSQEGGYRSPSRSPKRAQGNKVPRLSCFAADASSIAQKCLDALEGHGDGSQPKPSFMMDLPGEDPDGDAESTEITCGLAWPPPDLHSRPLLKFNNKGNEAAVLAPEGMEAIAALPEDCSICPVILIGDGRGGKSYLSSRILGAPDAFRSDNTAEPVTEGIDIVIAPVAPLLKDAGVDDLCARKEYLLIMDCEGGNNAMAAIRTLVNVFGIIIGTEVVFVAGGMASEQALQNLAATLGARALIRLDDNSKLPAQRLVFVVNMNTLRYSADTLERILNASYDGERGELRETIKDAFPHRCFHSVPLMGSPDFEDRVADLRRSLLENRSPLTLDGMHVRPKQLQGLLEIIVTEVRKANEVSFPSMTRYIIYDSFLMPIVTKLLAEVKNALPELTDYDAMLESKDPRPTALKRFDDAVSHVRQPIFVQEARVKLTESLDLQWETLCARNTAYGEQVREVRLETQEIFQVSQRHPAAHRGILKALTVTHNIMKVEQRSVVERKRGGEPEGSTWEDTGQTIVRLAETSLENWGRLPVLKCRLWKRNPNVWQQIISLGRRAFVSRQCLLIDGHFMWWEPGKENIEGEGGCINLFVHEAEVLVDPFRSSCFVIRPANVHGWHDPESFTGGSRREFMFNCDGADIDVQCWLAGFQEHVAFGARVREQLGREHLRDAMGVRKYKMSVADRTVAPRMSS